MRAVGGRDNEEEEDQEARKRRERRCGKWKWQESLQPLSPPLSLFLSPRMPCPTASSMSSTGTLWMTKASPMRAPPFQI